MNNLFNHLQEAAIAKQETCNEQNCKTCFENRGCIYEQYLAMTIHTMEEAYLASQVKTATQQVAKRA